MSSGDTTHTIRYENRFAKFVVGIAIIAVLVKLYLSGNLQAVYLWLTTRGEALNRPGTGLAGYDSIVGYILPILFDAVTFVGGVGITSFFLLKDVVIGAIGGVSQLIATFQASSAAQSKAAVAATVQAKAAQNNTPTINGEKLAAFLDNISKEQQALANKLDTTLENQEKQAFRLENLSSRLVELEDRWNEKFPPPPPPKSAEERAAELEAEVAAMREQLKAVQSRPIATVNSPRPLGA